MINNNSYLIKKLWDLIQFLTVQDPKIKYYNLEIGYDDTKVIGYSYGTKEKVSELIYYSYPKEYDEGGFK